MGRVLLAISLIIYASPVSAQPNPTRAVFEGDWVLMNWALKFFDRDHDMLLSDAEAQAAATEFRKLADTDHDGRVTPEEYRAARTLILAQY